MSGNKYFNISKKEWYDRLLASGMFWEFYPELSGIWDKDKSVILKEEILEEEKRRQLNKKFSIK